MDQGIGPLNGSSSAIEPLNPRQLQRQILIQERRDYQLWSILLLTTLVLGAGFAAALVPDAMWGAGTVAARWVYLPTLLYGFVTLIILFNIYLIGQRRVLQATKRMLLDQLVRADKAVRRSFLDPLTQLFNRHYMQHILPREIMRADRKHGELSILMVDVDDFKMVNTRLGHLGGDQCLMSVAGVLRRTFRQSDIIIRYGGDEFLVILPDTGEAQSLIAIKRLAREVALRNFKEDDRGYTISLSSGAATHRQGDDLNALLRRADERMYLHKAARQRRQSSPESAVRPANWGAQSHANTGARQASTVDRR